MTKSTKSTTKNMTKSTKSNTMLAKATLATVTIAALNNVLPPAEARNFKAQETPAITGNASDAKRSLKISTAVPVENLAGAASGEGGEAESNAEVFDAQGSVARLACLGNGFFGESINMKVLGDCPPAVKSKMTKKLDLPWMAAKLTTKVLSKKDDLAARALSDDAGADAAAADEEMEEELRAVISHALDSGVAVKSLSSVLNSEKVQEDLIQKKLLEPLFAMQSAKEIVPNFVREVTSMSFFSKTVKEIDLAQLFPTMQLKENSSLASVGLEFFKQSYMSSNENALEEALSGMMASSYGQQTAAKFVNGFLQEVDPSAKSDPDYEENVTKAVSGMMGSKAANKALSGMLSAPAVKASLSSFVKGALWDVMMGKSVEELLPDVASDLCSGVLQHYSAEDDDDSETDENGARALLSGDSEPALPNTLITELMNAGAHSMRSDSVFGVKSAAADIIVELAEEILQPSAQNDEGLRGTVETLLGSAAGIMSDTESQRFIHEVLWLAAVQDGAKNLSQQSASILQDVQAGKDVVKEILPRLAQEVAGGVLRSHLARVALAEEGDSDAVGTQSAIAAAAVSAKATGTMQVLSESVTREDGRKAVAKIAAEFLEPFLFADDESFRRSLKISTAVPVDGEDYEDEAEASLGDDYDLGEEDSASSDDGISPDPSADLAAAFASARAQTDLGGCSAGAMMSAEAAAAAFSGKLAGTFEKALAWEPVQLVAKGIIQQAQTMGLESKGWLDPSDDPSDSDDSSAIETVAPAKPIAKPITTSKKVIVQYKREQRRRRATETDGANPTHLSHLEQQEYTEEGVAIKTRGFGLFLEQFRAILRTEAEFSELSKLVGQPQNRELLGVAEVDCTTKEAQTALLALLNSERMETVVANAVEDAVVRLSEEDKSTVYSVDSFGGQTLGQTLRGGETRRLSYSQTLPTDSFFARQWGFHNTATSARYDSGRDINMPEAWTAAQAEIDRLKSAGILPETPIVAVIDTGIDYTHPDLRGNMWVNEREIPNDGIDNDGNGYIDDVHGIDTSNSLNPKDGDPFDDQGHGTHCAGVIGATYNNGVGVAGVAGIAKAKLMAIKFLNEDGSGSASGALEGLNYAIANGAVVSNNSWGGSWNGPAAKLFMQVLAEVQEDGHLMVSAAGNDNRNNDHHENATLPCNLVAANNICVASSTNVGRRSNFSNYGRKHVDVFAPGTKIYSTVPNKDGLYAYMSGTSMATPHVAGLAALLKAYRPQMSIPDLRNNILRSVRTHYFWNSVNTGGIVDAHESLRRAKSDHVASVAPNARLAANARLLRVDSDLELGKVNFGQRDFVLLDFERANEAGEPLPNPLSEVDFVEMFFMDVNGELRGAPVRGRLEKTTDDEFAGLQMVLSSGTESLFVPQGCEKLQFLVGRNAVTLSAGGSVAFVDAVGPLEKARAFTVSADTHTGANVIAGKVAFRKAQNDKTISEYRLYAAHQDANGDKVQDKLLKTIDASSIYGFEPVCAGASCDTFRIAPKLGGKDENGELNAEEFMGRWEISQGDGGYYAGSGAQHAEITLTGPGVLNVKSVLTQKTDWLQIGDGFSTIRLSGDDNAPISAIRISDKPTVLRWHAEHGSSAPGVQLEFTTETAGGYESELWNAAIPTAATHFALVSTYHGQEIAPDMWIWEPIADNVGLPTSGARALLGGGALSRALLGAGTMGTTGAPPACGPTDVQFDDMIGTKDTLGGSVQIWMRDRASCEEFLSKRGIVLRPLMEGEDETAVSEFSLELWEVSKPDVTGAETVETKHILGTFDAGEKSANPDYLNSKEHYTIRITEALKPFTIDFKKRYALAVMAGNKFGANELQIAKTRVTDAQYNAIKLEPKFLDRYRREQRTGPAGARFKERFLVDQMAEQSVGVTGLKAYFARKDGSIIEDIPVVSQMSFGKRVCGAPEKQYGQHSDARLAELGDCISPTTPRCSSPDPKMCENSFWSNAPSVNIRSFIDEGKVKYEINRANINRTNYKPAEDVKIYFPQDGYLEVTRIQARLFSSSLRAMWQDKSANPLGKAFSPLKEELFGRNLISNLSCRVRSRQNGSYMIRVQGSDASRYLHWQSSEQGVHEKETNSSEVNKAFIQSKGWTVVYWPTSPQYMQLPENYRGDAPLDATGLSVVQVFHEYQQKGRVDHAAHTDWDNAEYVKFPDFDYKKDRNLKMSSASSSARSSASRSAASARARATSARNSKIPFLSNMCDVLQEIFV